MAGADILIAGWFVPTAMNIIAQISRENYKVMRDKEVEIAKLEATAHELKKKAEEAEKLLFLSPSPDWKVKAWLNNLKDVLYKAWDVLDTIDYKKLCKEMKQQGKLSSTFYKNSKNLLKIDDEINELKHVIIMLEMAKATSITDIKSSSESVRSMNRELRETQPGVDDQLVGLSRKKDKIIKWVTENKHNKPIVVCITGFGGVGKSSLAKQVYNSERVKKAKFKLLWVNLRSISNAKDVVKEILSQNHYALPTGEQNLPNLLQKLQKVVDGKKYLLVLLHVQKVADDEWKKLQTGLRNGVTGCAIIVTTRDRAVANSLTEKQIEVDFLTKDDCMKLFWLCLNNPNNLSEDKLDRVKKIQNKVCQLLHGLPKSVKILAQSLNSSLHSKTSIQVPSVHWWEDGKLANEVLPTLLSNYLDLPSDLQQCFAYCSLFPRNYNFIKDRLVQMWIAQGYIQPTQSKRMEDIGREWFDTLTSRFFFDRKSNGDFVMHERVRDLAVYVSRDECFVAEDITAKPLKTVRHLTINSNNAAGILNNLQCNTLRSLLIFYKIESEEFQSSIEKIINKSKSLRVLVTRSDLPPQFLSDLVHLRYLRIMSSTQGKMLSGSISRLLYLQFLDLGRDSYNSLPKGMSSLINLRHFWAEKHTVSLVSGIGNLTSLQELQNFYVDSKDGHKITELKGMNQLRGSLVISNLNHVSSKEEALEAKLINKIHLDTLQLKDGIKEEVLEGLQPHRKLRNLDIRDYVSQKFPRWMLEISNHFTDLRFIKLCNHHKLISLPPMGQIKSLKFLILSSIGVKKIGDELYGESGDVFPSLKELTIDRLGELTEWSGVKQRKFKQRKFFPVLEKLHILDCKRLKSMPSRSSMASLNEIKIKNCHRLEKHK